MRKFYMVFTVVVIGLILFSCGLKLPSKPPEKVKVQYTKYLEFPLTTLDLKARDLVDSFANQLGGGLILEKTDPVTLKYATEITYSPGTLLQDVQNELESKLGELGSRFEYKIDTSYFLNAMSGQIELPSVKPVVQEINQSEVEIGNLTLISGLIVPVTGGTNVFDVPSTALSTLIFSEANLKSVNVRFTIEQITGSNAALLIDGTTYPITVNGIKNLANVLIKKTSSVKVKFDSASSGMAKISLAFENQKVDYLKDLDTSKLDGGKISINVSQHIPITSGTWKLALGGNVGIKLTIAGFSGNISQNYSVVSGSNTVGIGSSNSLNTQISLDDTKLFTVGDGIDINGTIELTGLVSADLRTKPKVQITPNVQVKKIQDYPLSVNVPLPNNVTELKFTSDSGYMLLNFSGLTSVNVSGTFGNNALTSTAAGVQIPFQNVSLPALVSGTISGNVTGNMISYTIDLPSDQTIKIATAKISGISIAPISFSQPVPSEVRNFVSEATATIKVKLNYNVGNISGITLNIASNIFDSGNGTYVLSGQNSIVLQSVNKLFDFSTFTSFDLTIIPLVPLLLTVSDIDIREGVNLWIEPIIEKFEISKVKLKGQTFTQDLGTLINFGDIFKDEFAFIRELDLNINASVSFDITNSTIPATLTLNISGNTVNISKGTPVNIGNIIETLISGGSPLSISITVETDPGELTKDSEIKANLGFTLPISANTPDHDVVISSGTVDLSQLEPLKELVDNVSIKFKTYSNTTGLKAKLKLGQNGEVEVLLSDSVPTIGVNKDDIETLAKNNTPYQILLPKNSNIALNYNGKLSVAPYIAVELKVATEVKLGN
ncbi:hypothetical protein [Fervidobacterium islandicum]|uniref:hypothetical protein n=1 Tax=Fervidobacterium islandicum TaxID=2423 RepID=UPI003A775BDC